MLGGLAYAYYLSDLGGSMYSTGLTIIAVAATGLYLYCLALLVGATVNRLLSTRPDSDSEAFSVGGLELQSEAWTRAFADPSGLEGRAANPNMPAECTGAC